MSELARKSVTVYVRLLSEGTEVSRPIQAQKLREGLYKLTETSNYHTEDEQWEFPPGSLMRCEQREQHGEKFLLAVELVPTSEPSTDKFP